jgi:hypothetical protein
MQKIELGEGGKITLETTLTNGQVAKFNSLVRNLIINNGAAYLPIDELHGVLLTNSRERAKTIINNYSDVVKGYLVSIPNELSKHGDGVSSSIAPIGIYSLLETLARDNPKKANDYRASLTLLSYIIAKHPQLALSSQIKAKQNEAIENSVIAKLKRKHTICQLSEELFVDDTDEKHAHHIEGKSEDPSLAFDEQNLIIIKGSIHKAYHSWVIENQREVTRATLKNFARRNQLSISAL